MILFEEKYIHHKHSIIGAWWWETGAPSQNTVVL